MGVHRYRPLKFCHEIRREPCVPRSCFCSCFCCAKFEAAEGKLVFSPGLARRGWPADCCQEDPRARAQAGFASSSAAALALAATASCPPCRYEPSACTSKLARARSRASSCGPSSAAGSSRSGRGGVRVTPVPAAVPGRVAPEAIKFWASKACWHGAAQGPARAALPAQLEARAGGPPRECGARVLRRPVGWQSRRRCSSGWCQQNWQCQCAASALRAHSAQRALSALSLQLLPQLCGASHAVVMAVA